MEKHEHGEKAVLRSGLYLGPQNPVDKARPGPAAAAPNVPLAPSRPASALPQKRPLTANPASAAAKRPHSKTGPPPPVEPEGFLAKAYASGAPPPVETAAAKPPTTSTLFHGFPYGGGSPAGTGAFTASQRPTQRPPSAVHGASSLIMRPKKFGANSAEGGGHSRPVSAMPAAVAPGTPPQPETAARRRGGAGQDVARLFGGARAGRAGTDQDRAAPLASRSSLIPDTPKGMAQPPSTLAQADASAAKLAPKDAKSTAKYEHSFQPRGINPRMRMASHAEPAAERSGDSIEEVLADLQRQRDEFNGQVAVRVRKWYQLLQVFKKQPDSVEFVYLVNAAPDSVHYNPYNLEVVDHADTKGARDYYTMSSQGVTHFWDDCTDFQPLDSFERDYFLYAQTMRLRMFRQFRMWKGFKVWRRSVATRKAAAARQVLSKNLFILHPVFRDAILKIRAACDELAAQKLHALTPGEPSVTLEAFLARHRAHAESVLRMLHSFSRGAVHTTQDACYHAIEVLEQTLLASKEKSTNSNKLASAAATSVRLAVVRATNMADEAQFSYAINAARRSEKRRVHNFVRLLDYMICNALHMLLVGSSSEMLQALTPAVPPNVEQAAQEAQGAGAPSPLPSPDVSKMRSSETGTQEEDSSMAVDQDPLMLMGGMKKAEWGGPLLQLQVLMQEANAAAEASSGAGAAVFQGGHSSSGMPDSSAQGEHRRTAVGWSLPDEPGSSPETLVLRPQPLAFHNAFMEVQEGFVQQVQVVRRLLLHERLKDYMEQPLDSNDCVDVDGFCSIIVGEEHNMLVQDIAVQLRDAFTKAEQLRNRFMPFRDMVIENRQVSEESMLAEVRAGKRTVNTFRRDLDHFKEQLQDIRRIKPKQELGVLVLHLEEMLKALLPSPQRCLQAITDLLPKLTNEKYTEFIDKVHSATTKLQQPPTSVEELAEYLELHASLEKERGVFDKEYDRVTSYVDLMHEYSVPVPDIQAASYATMDSDYTALRDAMWSADASRDTLIMRFNGDLESQSEAVNKEVMDIRLSAQHEMILDDESAPEQVMSYTRGLLERVGSQKEVASKVNRFQRMFRLKETIFQDLSECEEDVRLRHMLWESRMAWEQDTQKWLATPLGQIDGEGLENAVARFNKQVYKMERGLEPNKVVPKLRESLNLWRDFFPVVQNLTNPDLKDRHWTKLIDVLGEYLHRDESLTLEALLKIKILEHKDQVMLISTEATQEAALEGMLDKINEKWRFTEFTVNSYKDLKDTYILGGVDEVMMVLEDCMVAVATISSSRFVGGIRHEVEKTEKALRLFSDTMDEWLECQRQWLYLETIFSAADIQRQLPAEAKAFIYVDRQFKDVMRKTKDRPNAMMAATAPGVLEAFKRCNETLEQVQKNLEDYLETKRVSFPRFYFLSNDELLEILSQTRNAQAVQPHLQKCFDGIRYLDFGNDPKSIDIHAMVSGEGERVPMGKNLKARGAVETWLTSVESAMRLSVRQACKRAVKLYPTTKRTEWVQDNPAQLIIVVSNVFWCSAVEECFKDKDPTAALTAFHGENVSALKDLISLVRGKLTPLLRKSLGALITIDVHNRDIVEGLIAGKVTKASEFGWLMQLRYEYDAEAEQVSVMQVNARFNYGWEYLGAQPRLVVTPMTDRCYMTLTGALHMRLGGAPAGPAGTGKTETTKDLGKALGIQCVVFNCGENLDYRFMGKFFSGLAQCGAWACFDEFNRIDIEVLSVVAQQLLAIQNALKAGMDRFLFEAREIRLLPSCGVFITMNPGYAGRTELPDNLKALFRPMAMMIPDYALVAEVMLFSEGFEDAKNLSRKMVQLYKLASEQLSQQDHYDFGMRALKSVLVMAGALKRSTPDLIEDIVLIRAIRDSNIPKFLSEDARLFNAIVGDLFPGVTIPETDYGALQSAVDGACTKSGLQPVSTFTTKVIQLYETFNVRFGVMLVGPAGGGKTRCYQTLKSAMTQLRKDGNPDPNYQAVHTAVLNPKSIKMGELYGEYNVLTNEWQDGLASSIIRANVAQSTNEDRRWVVFDGPVDAIWVENMNTVLDDNCTLCLPNGERIKLNPVTMRMLFEVADLAVASPATVSRCGMVYVPQDCVGWRPYIKSWLVTLTSAHGLVADENQQNLLQMQADFAASRHGSTAASQVGKDELGEDSSLPPEPSALENTEEAGAPDGQNGGIPATAEAVAAASSQYRPELLHFIYDLFDRFVDPMLQFLRANCSESVPSSDMNLVTSVAQIFTSLTHPSKGLCLTGETDDSIMVALQYAFSFAAVWGIGGNMNSSCWDKWDAFVRDLFEGTANYPGGSGTVFDYYVDPKKGFTLAHWDDIVPKFQYQPELPYFQILVPTTDTTRYAFMLKTCLEVEHSVLFTGSSGVGKTAVILDTLSRMADADYGTVEEDNKDAASFGASTVATRTNVPSEQNLSVAASKQEKTIMPVILNFSAQTSSAATQAMIECKLERKRKQRYGPPAGRHVVLFVDDVNMPMREVHGAQPPIELLRQLLDFGGFYDRKKLEWMGIQDTTLCAACGPPGGGRQEVSSRFLRHFTMLSMPPPSEPIMRHIFSTILGGFFDTFFSADVKNRMLKPMVGSAIEVYLRIASELLPTPAKSHYTFNLRDVSKVFQGILGIRPAQCPEPHTTLMRLWVHENMRVFHDRLVSKEDKDYFKGMLYEMLKSKFEVRDEYDALFGYGKEIMFGDWMQMGAPRDKRVYEEVGGDYNKITTTMTNYLDEYNMEHTAPMHLVFFMDAVQHISRIARILRQPRGSAMLVGVGGSGKQSLTRFAAFISETQCFSIELTRNFGLTEFRESIKKLYKIAGVEGRHVAFLFTDNHIVSESFLEDINNMLNSGEITGLFPADERERIYSEIRPWINEQGVAETRDAMWAAFINRVRDNLHIVLAMSPVGDSFRARCRQFPSLISCCTIDWFSPWPAEALKSVSTRFLETQQLGGDLVNAAISSMCVDIHLGVAETAEAYYAELRRRYYVTPKSYLDLIHLYISLLRETRQEMALARDRLLNGLSKLQETNVVVDRMQKELNELQPVLAEKTKDTQRLLVQVDNERTDAESIRHTVVEEEVEVKLKQAETQHLKDDAQKDLEHVLPALQDAENTVQQLNRQDIQEIKTFAKPPQLVQLTMEGVCTLLGERPDWDTAKRVLSDSGFTKRLVEYDKDNISDKTSRLLKRIIDDPQFTPDQVGKQSKASMSLCLWVRAIDTYAKVSKVVEPKRVRLRQAQSALDAMNAAFAAKREQLQQIEAKVDALQKQLQTTQAELASLQQQADLSSKRLSRAAKLISALGDESVRWRSTADDLGDKMLLLVGDVFLSAACISYTGAFTGPYRSKLINSWVQSCIERDIPVSENFSLQSTLSSSVEVREWNLQGLPTDSLSIDNGILVTRGSRWPLMVDPQDQANRWVKAMESKNGLRTLRVTDPNILRTLENCVRVGSPVLLEDVGESLEPSLDPLLLKQTFVQGTRNLIRLGDTDVDYDPNFRFYMTTKLPNPHYLPEVCIKVNLINFTVTRKGLEDQLLGDVVRKERPELEEIKDRLVVSISNDKRQLADLEDKVLKLLRESEGNILDDEVLINVLNNSKTTSGQINVRVREAEDTEKAINAAREVYRTVPVRGSILYFVIADLSGIDPMYQYSLSYFTSLFNHCITAAAPSDDLPTRLDSLLSYITEFMYKMVCRGLFEAHKGIFSFLIASAIERDAGIIPQPLWSLLLRGSAAGAQLSEKPQPLSMRWLSANGWAALKELQAGAEHLLPQDRLLECLKAKGDVWQKVSESTQPWSSPDFLSLLEHDLGLPLRPPSQQDPKAASKADPEELRARDAAAAAVPFLTLLLVRVLCEDKLVDAVQHYVGTVLGPQYNESPSSSLSEVYKDSNPATPIIFILSQGADPTSSLARFGEGMGQSVGDRLHVISLGQGQGPIAESTLNMAIRAGDWVCLQNCHLARSWMPRLERLVEDLQARHQRQEAARAAEEGTLGGEDSEGEGGKGDAESANDAMSMRSQSQSRGDNRPDVHPDFRLWLTSMPAPHFPVPVLQNGIKITQEPPKGVRANLLRTYQEMPAELLEPPPTHNLAPQWRRLVFSAAFFHAIIQERRKYGPLGWNIGYEFNTGDLECALKTLRMFMEPAEGGSSIPWEALTYVTGQINYGGRVTDDNDRRLLMCTLSQYYCPEALKDGYELSPGGYGFPAPDSDLTAYVSHIGGLPRQETPEVFGLHSNAAIALNLQEARKLLETVLAIQPRLTPASGGSGAKSSEQLALEVASSVEEQLPQPLDLASASVVRSPFALLPSGHDNSLGTVLKQEIDRFNNLLTVLKRTCAELQRAVKGLAIMSPALEEMASSLINNQVPSLWARVAYPSLKPLASWVADFRERMAFMESWLMNGEPTSFWLSGLFFPQGFMTAVLQNHARKTGVPIDRFSFSFKVLRVPEGAAKQLAKEAAAAGKKPESWLPPSQPSEGVYVHGLFLEGARWDEASGTLREARAREMTSRMPPIHFLPTDTTTASTTASTQGEGSSHSPDGLAAPHAFYDCPLYKTSVRAGVLSTTGQSTNFVLHIRLPLPRGARPEQSIMQGVAALCALNS